MTTIAIEKAENILALARKVRYTSETLLGYFRDSGVQVWSKELANPEPQWADAYIHGDSYAYAVVIPIKVTNENAVHTMFDLGPKPKNVCRLQITVIGEQEPRFTIHWA